ncbi:MAG: hypothetical protein IKA33_04445 [Candidatus Methanomethylophilaceae archaeon]|nr:hypothetical protein [Candidatus Methanomethylophilaceae archaeon]
MNPKVVVASLVLVLSLASVVSIGVTESWFSDSEQSEIEIMLAPLEIEYSVLNESEWDTWNGIDDAPTVLDGMVIRSNYAVFLSITGNKLSLSDSANGLNLDAGVQYKLSGGTSGWTAQEVNSL